MAFLSKEEKCSACKAVMYELDRMLRFEKPQSGIMKNRRLSSDGKVLHGEVTDYRNSELRAITIVDSLCAGMKDYGKVQKDGHAKWIRVNYAEGDVVIDGSMTLGGQQSTAEGRALQVYCDKIVEQHEDAFTAAVQEGPDGLEEKLCVNTAKLCLPDLPSAEEEAASENAAATNKNKNKNKNKKKKKKLSAAEKKVAKMEKALAKKESELERLERIKQEKNQCERKTEPGSQALQKLGPDQKG